MNPERDETVAPVLTLPATPPAPVQGCRECARLDVIRARARSTGDHSAVSDCNVLIARHPH